MICIMKLMRSQKTNRVILDCICNHMLSKKIYIFPKIGRIYFENEKPGFTKNLLIG